MQNQVAWIGCGLGRVLGASQAAIARGWQVLRTLAVTLLLAVPLTPAVAEGPLWIRQAGTVFDDISWDVAVDGDGNAYITGYTAGDFSGPTAGAGDSFLAKYNPTGTLLWMRQIGTASTDSASGIAVGNAGHVYITGSTSGSLGGPSAGNVDAFLAKYDAAGSLLWVRQVGTAAGDYANAVALDGDGHAYITGETRGSLGGPSSGNVDAFLAKYDSAGTLLWVRQSGTAATDSIATGMAVAVDSGGNAYITGWTNANLGGPNAGDADIFLTKFNSAGTLLWIRQAGTAGTDIAQGVAVDGAGNVYITGSTSGSLGGPNAGDYDSFLAKYSPSGTLLWLRQNGSAGSEGTFDLAVDDAGNAYITGYTSGNLVGGNAGAVGTIDLFLAKYDVAGNLLWMRQTGTEGQDAAYAVAVDGVGNTYITGGTTGNLAGPNAGSYDVFLAKYPPCTPPAIVTNPTGINSCRTAGAAFNIAATATPLVTYRWRKAGVPIDTAANPSAATDTLRLVRVQAGDAGLYDCIVSTDCGSVTSAAARLTVRTCICLEADIAGGGDAGNEPDGTVDGTDFIAFINSFAIGDAAVDPLADIAGGGDTGLEPDGTIDGTDFIAFINAFAIGC